MSPHTRWFTWACPLGDECSKQSWSRTRQCQSFESKEDCLEKVKQHVARSDLHFDSLKKFREVGGTMKDPCDCGNGYLFWFRQSCEQVTSAHITWMV